MLVCKNKKPAVELIQRNVTCCFRTLVPAVLGEADRLGGGAAAGSTMAISPFVPPNQTREAIAEHVQRMSDLNRSRGRRGQCVGVKRLECCYSSVTLKKQALLEPLCEWTVKNRECHQQSQPSRCGVVWVCFFEQYDCTLCCSKRMMWEGHTIH